MIQDRWLAEWLAGDVAHSVPCATRGEAERLLDGRDVCWLIWPGGKSLAQIWGR